MKTYFKFLLTTSLLVMTHFLYCQLNVSTSSANALVNNILGNGVAVSNATLISPGTSAGQFTGGGGTNIGVNEGILLTSGSINNAIGPNNSASSGVNNNAGGDADLNSIVGNTLDACVLEFDFIPAGTFISFNYVFASEEYPEYFCSQFNDAFAFLVSGPKPGGGAYTNENIALIPGTTTPVAINNVGPTTCNGVNNSSLYVNNSGGATIQYDGFTQLFSVSIDLIPCQSYHMKLVVADRQDRVYDSGVFIEKGSFISSTIDLTADIISPECPGGSDGSIDLNIDGGLAPYSLLWNTGSTSDPLSDVSAGSYNVVVTDANGCTESAEFAVLDGIDVVSPSIICVSNISIDLGASGSVTVIPSDLVIDAFDNCGAVTLAINEPSTFDCGDVNKSFLLTTTVTDLNGNTNACVSEISITDDNLADDDCDGVSNICDVCDGGDDSVDANLDGIADCSQLLPYNSYSNAWKCANNKIYVCHNDGNSHTICISKNALADHFSHGDNVGPFTSCDPESVINELDIEFDLDHDHGYLVAEAYPNPATNEVNFKLEGISENSTFYIHDINGRIVYNKNLLKGQKKLQVDLSSPEFGSGFYFVMVVSAFETYSSKFLISKD